MGLRAKPIPGATVSIADAKSRLSSVIAGVQQSRTPVTILRRGVAVAAIVPLIDEADDPPGYGYMRGTVQILGDHVGPSGEEWDVADGK